MDVARPVASTVKILNTMGVSYMSQSQHTNTELAKLSETDLTLADSTEDIRGRKVVDSNGEDMGHVGALFIDRDERKVRLLEIRAGGFLGIGDRHFLLPVEAITELAKNEVHINQTRDRVVNIPRLRSGARGRANAGIFGTLLRLLWNVAVLRIGIHVPVYYEPGARLAGRDTRQPQRLHARLNVSIGTGDASASSILRGDSTDDSTA